MSSGMRPATNRLTPEATSGSSWRSLLKVGGAASMAMAAITVLQFAAFMAAPPPYGGSALDWFALFQRNGFMGLLAYEFLMVVYMIVSIPLSLALYVTLRRTDQSLMAIYLLLSLLGVALFVVARPAFEMLFLSGQYAAATTEAQRAALLGAGNAMVAMFHGTSFQVSYFLGSVNGLIISAVMLGSGLFSKTTAYFRIASSVLDFGILIPQVGLVISLFSVFSLLIWNVLIARRLFQLARGQGGTVA